ncbi:hypothetical protein, partial [Leptospira interrogans]
ICCVYLLRAFTKFKKDNYPIRFLHQVAVWRLSTKIKNQFIEVLLRFIGCKKFVNKNILKFIKTKYIIKDEYLSI